MTQEETPLIVYCPHYQRKPFGTLYWCLGDLRLCRICLDAAADLGRTLNGSPPLPGELTTLVIEP